MVESVFGLKPLIKVLDRGELKRRPWEGLLAEPQEESIEGNYKNAMAA